MFKIFIMRFFPSGIIPLCRCIKNPIGCITFLDCLRCLLGIRYSSLLHMIWQNDVRLSLGIYTQIDSKVDFWPRRLAANFRSSLAPRYSTRVSDKPTIFLFPSLRGEKKIVGLSETRVIQQ